MSNIVTPNDQLSTRLGWLAAMDANLIPTNTRKSGIICTIGPNTNSPEAITALRKAGMNIVRMNFSHGSYEYHGSVISNARASVEQYNDGRTLAIALDTKGPEIRTGLMANGADVPIAAGHEMVFTTDPAYAEACTDSHYYVDYLNLPKVISPGKHIYVDDGILTFEVLHISDSQTVRVKALNAGKLSSKKGVNLPGTDVDLPALSEKDQKDLRFGVSQGVDMIFASFIRKGEDVRDIRRILGEDGKHIKIICKIENHQGVQNFQDILKETDGIMIARGDLGIEIPCQRVFIAQKAMIAQCNLAGKPVVCATQMLESMTYNPRPTRAEVSDVSNAILDGADCVMLSGETAKGTYPVKAVEMMHEVCLLAESVICYPPLFNETRSLQPRPTENTETIASSAVNAAIEHQAGAIIVLTTTGSSARLISKYRPRVPIITITRDPAVSRQTHLHRGCYPFLYAGEKRPVWQEDVEARIQFAVEQGVKHDLLKRGDAVIAVQGWKGGIGHTNTMRIIIA